jgi:hypothetical protein
MKRTNWISIAAAGAMVTTGLGITAPAMAQDGYYGRAYYGDVHRGGYDNYRPGDYYRGDEGYYRGPRYGYSSYNNGGYRYNDHDYYRCRSSGTTGTIVGAIAGGLLGNSVVGRHGDKTAGTLIGGTVGALTGRAIDKSDDHC